MTRPATGPRNALKRVNASAAEERRAELIETYRRLRECAEAEDRLASAMRDAGHHVGSRQKPMQFELSDAAGDELELAYADLKRLIEAPTTDFSDRAQRAINCVRQWYERRPVLPEDMRFNQARVGKLTPDDDLAWISTAARMLNDARSQFKRDHKLTRDEIRCADRRRRAAATDDIVLNEEHDVVTISGGDPIPLGSHDQTIVMKHVIEAQGGWISLPKRMGKRTDRIVVAMPPTVRQFIETKPGAGGGTRLRVRGEVVAPAP